jgi:hypothetical protein
VAQFAEFFDNVNENMPKMMGDDGKKAPMMTMTRLPDADGVRFNWVRVKPPPT